MEKEGRAVTILEVRSFFSSREKEKKRALLFLHSEGKHAGSPRVPYNRHSSNPLFLRTRLYRPPQKMKKNTKAVIF